MKTLRIRRKIWQKYSKKFAPKLISIENMKDSFWYDFMDYIVKNDSTGIAVHDNDLRYMFVSDRYLKDYNVKEKDIIGKHHYEVFPDLPEKWRAVHRRVLAGEVLTGKGDPYFREDGMVEYTQWECRPWHQPDGSIGGMVLYTEMMTEQVKRENAMEHQELIFRSAFNAIQEGIMILDTELNVLRVNETMDRWFGDQQPLVGKKCFEIWKKKPTACEVCPVKQSTESQQLVMSEVILEKPGKTNTVLEIYTYPMSKAYGNTEGFVQYIRDMTHRKQMEQVLVEEKEKAEAANEAKTQFLANMSHELRTPLNGLMGMLQLLEMTKLTDEQSEYIHIALNGSQSLTQVLEDILNYASLEKRAQKIIEKPFQLEVLLQEVVGLHQAVAVRKGLFLSIYQEKNLSEQVLGDRFKLKEILGNLVGNAVKFTESGAVQLSVKQSDEEVDQGRMKICFQVKDTGIGIPPEKLEYIFQRFSQADESHTREYGGLGLGLAVAKEQATILGGNLTAESTQGQGSVFTLTCEVGVEQQTKPATDPLEAGQVYYSQTRFDDIRVLVVDDDYASRMMAQLHLEKMGYDVETTNNGQSAMEKFAAKEYHLVFMDCQMPVMDGYEATRGIREMESKSGRYTPIIAMTAKVLPGDRERCMEAGMDGFLAKPIEVDRMKEAVKRFSGLLDGSE